MADEAHFQFYRDIRAKFPDFFHATRVLDVGSLDVNGCNRQFFPGCDYTGLDIGPGKNVDVVCLGHEYDAPDGSFDVVTSSNAFEHDIHLEKTFKNMLRVLRPGGLFFFCCPGPGFPEHGTARTDSWAAPHIAKKNDAWKSYYRNVEESQIRSFVDIDAAFSSYEFSVYRYRNRVWTVLRFWGIKK